MKCKLIYSKLNPAVIKGMILRSSLNEINEHAANFREIIMELEVGSERDMYVRLYKFCRDTFFQKFLASKRGTY